MSTLKVSGDLAVRVTGLHPSPFGEKGPEALRRRRSSNAILAPSITESSVYAIALNLALNEQVWLACPTARYDPVTNAIADTFLIDRLSLRRRLEHLDGPRNPFDSREHLKHVLSSDYLAEDINEAVDMAAVTLLMNTPEAGAIERTLSPDIRAELHSFDVPAFWMPHVWMPMAYRTRYLLKRHGELESRITSADPYEADIHNWLSRYPTKRQRTLDSHIDHRPKILSIIAEALNTGDKRPFENAVRFPVWWKDKAIKRELSEVLDHVANLLYEPPYYISIVELRRALDREMIDLTRFFAASPWKTLAWGFLANVPTPFPLPNPVGLVELFKQWRDERIVRAEHGWLLYLVNIMQAAPFFRKESIAAIPCLKRITLRDDVLYTVAGFWLITSNGRTLHRYSCRHLRQVSRQGVTLCLDEAGNLLGQDVKECRTCSRGLSRPWQELNA